MNAYFDFKPVSFLFFWFSLQSVGLVLILAIPVLTGAMMDDDVVPDSQANVPDSERRPAKRIIDAAEDAPSAKRQRGGAASVPDSQLANGHSKSSSKSPSKAKPARSFVDGLEADEDLADKQQMDERSDEPAAEDEDQHEHEHEPERESQSQANGKDEKQEPAGSQGTQSARPARKGRGKRSVSFAEDPRPVDDEGVNEREPHSHSQSESQSSQHARSQRSDRSERSQASQEQEELDARAEAEGSAPEEQQEEQEDADAWLKRQVCVGAACV